MLSPNLFNTILVIPIVNILMVFYKIFLFIKIPGAFGFAIIGLTVFVRLLLNPFFKQQIEMAKKMQDLKPHLDKLSKKHKNDAKTLQTEQMNLYKQAGINPASGCLTMIIQMPIFIALYNTLALFFKDGSSKKIITDINNALYTPYLKISVIDLNFFGINLAQSPAKAHMWVYYLVPVITGILQYLQVAVSTPQTTEVKQPEEKSTTSENKSEDKTEDKDKKSNSGDFQKAMNTQMKYIFPIMIGWFSYSLPIGLSLYWNIFSLFSIIQYRKINSKSKILNSK
jgi:YidC/Oxa1 family membrane protein insertase